MIKSLCMTASLICACLFTSTVSFGQSVAGVSVISVANGAAETYSATELDYVASLYYGTYSAGYLFENQNQIRAGSATGRAIADGYMSAPSVSLSDYQLETDHYLIASYAFTDGGGDEFSNPYGFGFLPGGYGGNATYGPSGGPAYVVTQYLYLGTTIVAELDGPDDPTTIPSPDDSYLNEGDSFANTTPDQRRQIVHDWDAQIRAAMAANYAQKQQVPSYRFPVYASVIQDCGQQGDSLSANWVRHRRYRVYDNLRQPWSGDIDIREILYGYNGIGNGEWNTTEFLDHLSVGGLMPAGQTTSALQQFFASGGSFVGINIPLFILDRGRPFGTLSIV